MARHIDDANYAKVVFGLYCEHGLGKFANWLTMKQDSIQREEVVQSLMYPETRKAAQKLLEYYKFKIGELESMLAESEPTSA